MIFFEVSKLPKVERFKCEASQAPSEAKRPQKS